MKMERTSLIPRSVLLRKRNVSDRSCRKDTFHIQ